MKRPKLAGVFLLLAVLLAYLMFVRNHDSASRAELFPPLHRLADGRTADGGTADGGTSDGGTADGGTSDGRTSDGRTSDGGTSDGWTSDGRTSDGRTSDGWTSDGRTSDGWTSDGRTSDGRTSDGRTADGRTAGAGRSFRYGVMFDAGSTGTRVHIFRFQMENEGTAEPPRLDHETFRAIKPGLSAYADEPHKCSEGILQLLQVAQSSVPPSSWTSTPLVLKATAGLRLLPGEKAQHLLDTVRALFLESPFLSRDDSVSIMDGTDEGISAWITVNFLTGGLHGDGSTVGMLDLGGGSTQITFSPQDEKTIQTSPIDYIRSFQMFNITHTVYTHSYLGLGLMSARLAVLGGVDAPPLGGSTELVSPCLPADFSGSWEHADITYTVKGQKAGEPVYEACLNKVEKVLYRKVLKVSEAADVDFYAFSYYYDRAADLELIDEQQGGTVSVSQFTDAARTVCSDSSSIRSLQSPFLCLDLVYISVLLQELGFPPSKEFKLTRTINQVETSWALGATFHYMESLKNL